MTAGKLKRGLFSQKDIHGAFHDHAREVIANAKMLACAKPQMSLRIAVKIEIVSIRKLAFIPVC